MKKRKMDTWSFKSFFGKFLKECISLLKYDGGDQKLVSRLKRGIKSKIFDDAKVILEPELETSILKTMTHGDYWVNNMLFSSADPEDTGLTVTMLDFQLMSLAHPARDIWYLLYVNTDKEFRDKHLQTVLREYFQVFSGYLQIEGVKISFDDFLKDISPIRAPIAMIFSILVLFVGLNPEPIGFNTFSEMKQFGETFKRQVGSEPRDMDDPMVKEIRRRILGIIYELDIEGLL